MALACHCHRNELKRLNQACWNGEEQKGLVRPQPLDVTARRSHTISENTHHEVQASARSFVKGVQGLCVLAALSRTRCALVSRPAQSTFQFLFLQRPTLVLGLRSPSDGLTLRLDGGDPLGMFALGYIERRLRLVDGLLPAFALLLPGRLLPGLFALATLPLAFVGLGGLPIDRLVGGRGRVLRLCCWLVGV